VQASQAFQEFASPTSRAYAGTRQRPDRVSACPASRSTGSVATQTWGKYRADGQPKWRLARGGLLLVSPGMAKQAKAKQGRPTQTKGNERTQTNEEEELRSVGAWIPDLCSGAFDTRSNAYSNPNLQKSMFLLFGPLP
jgi:hypothetical protein